MMPGWADGWQSPVPIVTQAVELATSHLVFPASDSLQHTRDLLHENKRPVCLSVACAGFLECTWVHVSSPQDSPSRVCSCMCRSNAYCTRPAVNQPLTESRLVTTYSQRPHTFQPSIHDSSLTPHRILRRPIHQTPAHPQQEHRTMACKHCRRPSAGRDIGACRAFSPVGLAVGGGITKTNI